MHFADLREFVEFLDEHDQLEGIDGAHWDLEIGGLTEILVDNRPTPAIMFDDIVDYEPGYRLLTNALTTPFQWTAAMGLEPQESKRDAVIALKEQSEIDEVHPPQTVSSGPVEENVFRDDEVDVRRYPAPKWNQKDGGQYIGTGDVVVTKNADTGRLNAGTYRVQVHDRDEVSVMTAPGHDGLANKRSYLDEGEPCPMVVSLGHAPDIFIGANERVGSDVNELEFMGGRRGEGIEVIEGEVTGLPVPARSELVFEGHIYPDDDPVMEGPFGEFTGYYASGQHEEVPMTVERVYHRDDPINLGIQLVQPPAQAKTGLRTAAKLWNEVEGSGLPGISEVNALSFGPTWFHAISVDQQYAGHSVQVGLNAMSGPQGGYLGRFTVIVDDDVDVFDESEVLWAMCSRCDPTEDIQIVENNWSISIDPVVSPEKRESGDLTISRALIDATRPYHWREEFPKTHALEDDVREDLLAKWNERFGNRLE